MGSSVFPIKSAKGHLQPYDILIKFLLCLLQSFARASFSLADTGNYLVHHLTEQEIKMYGMVLQSMAAFLQENYGDAMYKAILKNAGISVMVFNTHEVYPDKYVNALAESAKQLLHEDVELSHYMELFGRKFVQVSYCARIITSYQKCLFNFQRFSQNFRNFTKESICLLLKEPKR